MADAKHTPGPSSGLMKPEQAAEYLQITPSTLAVWRSTNRKKLAFVKIGGQVRYRREDLDQFIADGLRGDMRSNAAKRAAVLNIAGPELLSAARVALHEMRQVCMPRNSFTEAIHALEDAIAKATGSAA